MMPGEDLAHLGNRKIEFIEDLENDVWEIILATQTLYFTGLVRITTRFGGQPTITRISLCYYYFIVVSGPPINRKWFHYFWNHSQITIVATQNFNKVFIFHDPRFTTLIFLLVCLWKNKLFGFGSCNDILSWDSRACFYFIWTKVGGYDAYQNCNLLYIVLPFPCLT